jgi:hypothetical protein
VAVACCELAFNDSRVVTARAITVAEAAPARPEDERRDKADCPDDHENDPCNLNVDTCDLSVHRPCQDRTNRDQQDAEADSHLGPTLSLESAFALEIPTF